MYPALCKVLKISVLVTVVLLIGACANTVAKEASQQKLITAQSAISDAIKAGATGQSNPKLASAKNHFETAQRAIRKKKYADADRYAELAESDAKLAEANASSVGAKKNLVSIDSDIKQLESKIIENEQTKAELAQ